MSNKVDFALLAPATGKTLRKSIYFVEVFFDLAKISWFVDGLISFVFFVKVLWAVNCSC